MKWLIGLMGLIGLISSIGYAADFTSSNFISRDSQPVTAGGRQESAGFINVGAAGQPVIGSQTSAGFENNLGNLYFSVGSGVSANIGTLQMSARVSQSTNPVGESDFVLTWTPNNNFRLFRACFGRVQSEVQTNCNGGATSAETTASTHTFTNQPRNTTFYFQVCGYDLDGNPLTTHCTNVVSGTESAFGPQGSGSGGTGGGAGGAGGAISAQASAPAGAGINPIEPITPINPIGPIGLIERIGVALGLVAPGTSAVPGTSDVKKSAPATAIGFQGNFSIVSDKKLEQIVFGGLPADITFFLRQFPELRQTFSELGVNKVSDVFKVASARFALPTVSQLVEATLPAGVPIAQLSPTEQKKLPSGVMLVRAPNEIIDIPTALVFDKTGKPQQLMNVVAGTEVKLIVKSNPDKPVDRVDGYLTYNTKEFVESPRLPTQSLVASIILTRESLVQPARSISKKLLIKEFPYVGKNGIFTASVVMPKTSGNYAITSVIIYKNKLLAAKSIDLVAVVDPEGYVYEQTARGKLRVEGARVVLYQCDTAGACAPWVAEKYQQRNPIITGDDGFYSFLTPPGQYYLKVEAKGYEKYQGEPFIIDQDNFVKINIELKLKSWWKKLFMI